MDVDSAPEARGIPSPVAPILLALVAGMAGAAGAVDLLPWKGEAKPALALNSLDHGRVDLADHAGRTVLVHFFATWCEPCIEEMGSLERLAIRRGSEPLSVLAIDVGEVDARVRSFFGKHPVSFPVLLDRERAVTHAWNVVALPSTFVLDGALAARMYAKGDVDWDDPAVDAALGALIAPQIRRLCARGGRREC